MKSIAPWFLIVGIVTMFVLMTLSQIGLHHLFETANYTFLPFKIVSMKVTGHLTAGLVILFFAWRECKKLKQSILSRLGLIKPKISWLDILALALGSLAFGWLARQLTGVLVELFSSQMPSEGPSPISAFEDLTTVWGILIVLLIALAPGFIEEIAYRGFLQRGLLKRYKPIVAIAISSIIFGLAHIEPQEIIFTTFMGLWLGIIAYKMNSIWPTIVCHIAINGWSGSYLIGKQLWGFPETPPMIFNGLFFIALIYAITILIRKKAKVDIARYPVDVF
ncbi:CPBP family intramembrane glutamic endopeptidase [Hyunsoonleella ulvae]|uniref:CPBP family intramembrane glutamic endopeptidase n=1 Tax=Hyunsoonleella ulvae TaxID=2799948 RepID=UPI00193A0526|nr:CPBP family intramembrane glutamic endopeptidase [Hyunsoonleella ulvae]